MSIGGNTGISWDRSDTRLATDHGGSIDVGHPAGRAPFGGRSMVVGRRAMAAGERCDRRWRGRSNRDRPRRHHHIIGSGGALGRRPVAMGWRAMATGAGRGRSKPPAARRAGPLRTEAAATAHGAALSITVSEPTLDHATLADGTTGLNVRYTITNTGAAAVEDGMLTPAVQAVSTDSGQSNAHFRGEPRRSIRPRRDAVRDHADTARSRDVGGDRRCPGSGRRGGGARRRQPRHRLPGIRGRRCRSTTRRRTH